MFKILFLFLPHFLLDLLSIFFLVEFLKNYIKKIISIEIIAVSYKWNIFRYNYS